MFTVPLCADTRDPMSEATEEWSQQQTDRQHSSAAEENIDADETPAASSGTPGRAHSNSMSVTGILPVASTSYVTQSGPRPYKGRNAVLESTLSSELEARKQSLQEENTRKEAEHTLRMKLMEAEHQAKMRHMRILHRLQAQCVREEIQVMQLKQKVLGKELASTNKESHS